MLSVLLTAAAEAATAAAEPAMNTPGFQNLTGDIWSIMGIGYLGIFIVTIIIILVVYLLNKLTNRKK